MSSVHSEIQAVVQGRSGEGWRGLARAITRVEETPPWELELPQPERPTLVVGITGPPGAGKSTLSGQLIKSFSDSGARVAVLAIDPSSPVTGGAVLGDRLRMEKHLLGRSDVYVRSLASRGAHGAIAAAARNAARLLELSGQFDVILIETVGAGQSEVAIAALADVVVLVTVPGLGDAVQAIKAGFLEVADVLVVNKADRPEAADTFRHFRLHMPHEVSVVQTVATDGDGVDALRTELTQRWETVLESGGLAGLRTRKFADEAADVAEAWVRACAGRAGIEPGIGLPAAVRAILEEASDRWKM